MANGSRNIYVGMAVSVAAGVLVIGIWGMQDIARLSSPFLAMPLPFIMGMAGSFWWWRPGGEGPGLFRIILMEILGIGLVYAMFIALIGGWSDVIWLVLIIYVACSPVILLAMFIGARTGFFLFFGREMKRRRLAAAGGSDDPVLSEDPTDAAR